MIKEFILVGSGGFLGSVLRFAVGRYFVQAHSSRVPLGTFVVNLVGCFLIGAFYAWFDKQGFFSQEVRLLIAVGFCGGFTTFSSFAAENFTLLKDGDILLFLLYVLASVVLGILFVWLGNFLVKTLFY